MFPSPTQPPSSDLPDLPTFPTHGRPENLAQHPLVNIARTLLIYSVCGAVSGIVVCGLAILGVLAYHELGRHLRHEEKQRAQMNAMEKEIVIVMNPELSFAGDLKSSLIFGCFAGSFGGVFMWLVGCFWSALKHPIRAGTFCASLTGSLILMAFAATYINGLLNRDQIHRSLSLIAVAMALAALFGFLHAILTSGALWLLARFPSQGRCPENA